MITVIIAYGSNEITDWMPKKVEFTANISVLMLNVRQNFTDTMHNISWREEEHEQLIHL
jgi:hypothetical protein